MAQSTMSKSCLKCSFKANDEKSFRGHFSVHEFESNFSLVCFYCPQRMTKLRAYDKHIQSCSFKPGNEKNCKPPDYPDLSQTREVLSGLVWECKICHEKFKLKSEPNLEDFKSVTSHCTNHAKSENVQCPLVNQRTPGPCDSLLNNYHSVWLLMHLQHPY